MQQRRLLPLMACYCLDRKWLRFSLSSMPPNRKRPWLRQRSQALRDFRTGRHTSRLAFEVGCTCMAVAVFAGTSLAAETNDIVVADFEAGDYGAWTATGNAFGSSPARGTLGGQQPVSGFEGHGLVNTFLNGDRSTGTLTSPEFTVERPYIRFLIGGGKNERTTVMQLVVDGAVVRAATGPNEPNRPDGTEALETDFWDVAELAGRKAVIRIIDNATGGWGHLNVDQIVQTERRPMKLAPASRDIVIDKKFLAIPIKNGAQKRTMTVVVEGRPVVRNTMELADGAPDWWAVMDVEAWRGKTLTLKVDKLPEDSRALSSIEQTSEIKGNEPLYGEALRGQFHFSPRRGWNNDPNGCVFYRGEYHLFFQHNPYGWDWGNMHWGHAVSKDLVHWKELGDKLLPDAMGPMFSGSAVVDWNNTSGFGKDGKAPLVLFYTAAGNPTVQCLAYSIDGRHFTKYAGNPILKEVTGGNRDPKVIWHEPTKQWVMTLYVELNKIHTIHFFTSSNLKDWKFASKTDGFFECPDFFELNLDGDPVKRRWVLTGASSEYQVGTFDGKTFQPETTKTPGHRGKGFYAAQTFSDIPQADARRIQLGWFQTPTPGMPFNQSMTIPLELGLVSTREGPRLTWTPVRELAELRAKTIHLQPGELQQGSPNPLAAVREELQEIRAEFAPSKDSEVIFQVRGATIAYNAQKAELSVNGNRASAPLVNGKQRLIIYCDRNGLEVFASDGLTYVPMPFLPKAENLSAKVEIAQGSANILNLEAYGLKSAWSKR